MLQQLRSSAISLLLATILPKPSRTTFRSTTPSKGSLEKLYPDAGVFKVDNSKSIRDLGLTYKHDFGTMLKDTLKKLEELEAEGK
ncbi:hypothetical protein FRC00_008753 [Tulasnella sp. 408]|nr:hypothetical protein FRC00_008753 [Tulasnella sp. 408]